MSGDLRSRSRVILDGPDRAQARAYLKGIGFDDDALRRPIVGIATQSLQHTQNLGAMTAQTVISMVPTLVVFAIFQRYFLMGLTAGSVKS